MNRSAALPLALCAALLALGGCKESKAPAAAGATPDKAQFSSDEQRMGYSLGASMGQQFRNDRLQVDADARITHLKLQQEAEHTVHLARIDAVQGRGARFASHSLSFGARLARHDIATRFDGAGCEALLTGLYHLDGRRHVDHHTRIDHARPRGTSRAFYRGLLGGASRGVFTGRVIVARDAQRSDAMQRCDNLLLSRQAEANARPELEIYADDVKCSHGATVGQLDGDSLFYLRTRGLDEADARRLLTYAFAAEALDRIEPLPLRRQAGAALMACLPGGELLEETL